MPGRDHGGVWPRHLGRQRLVTRLGFVGGPRRQVVARFRFSSRWSGLGLHRRRLHRLFHRNRLGLRRRVRLGLRGRLGFGFRFARRGLHRSGHLRHHGRACRSGGSRRHRFVGTRTGATTGRIATRRIACTIHRLRYRRDCYGRAECQHPQHGHFETCARARRQRQVAAAIQGHLVPELHHFRAQALGECDGVRAFGSGRTRYQLLHADAVQAFGQRFQHATPVR